MSSAISTDPARLKSGQPPVADDSLQPWQFFVLAALACATAVTFVVRGQGPMAVVLLALLMGAIALVGIAVLRTVRPLVGAHQDRTSMIGERTRAALEREKMLTLRSIKELEFDRAMGKLSDDDFREMSGRLRLRAAGLMRQLDAGAGYRAQVERDLAKRLGMPPDQNAPAYGPEAKEQRVRRAHIDERGAYASDGVAAGESSSLGGSPAAGGWGESSSRPDLLGPPSGVIAQKTCVSCSTQNDPDARFCKQCGAQL